MKLGFSAPAPVDETRAVAARHDVAELAEIGLLESLVVRLESIDKPRCQHHGLDPAPQYRVLVERGSSCSIGQELLNNFPRRQGRPVTDDRRRLGQTWYPTAHVLETRPVGFFVR